MPDADLLAAEISVQALIVDRDPNLRAFVAATLAPLGWRITEAENGHDALCKAVALRPDVLVTELRLPLIDGPALCELFRADPDLHGLGVIVVGDGAPPDIERATRAGADSVLVKPFTSEQILLEARRLICRSRELRERSNAVRQRGSDQLKRSDDLTARAAEPKRHGSRLHARYETRTPPHTPPSLRCPKCDADLEYVVSHVGGVSEYAREQWDEFHCGSCGSLEYRHRTRRLRFNDTR